MPMFGIFFLPQHHLIFTLTCSIIILDPINWHIVLTLNALNAETALLCGFVLCLIRDSWATVKLHVVSDCPDLAAIV